MYQGNSTTSGTVVVRARMAEGKVEEGGDAQDCDVDYCVLAILKGEV